MRILIMLNPTNRYGTKAAYTELRKFLIKDGYIKLQSEVFMRIENTNSLAPPISEGDTPEINIAIFYWYRSYKMIKCPEFLRKCNSQYIVIEQDNVHAKTNCPSNLLEGVKEYRKEHYGDKFVYGDPAIHSETKDGIHLDKE